MGVAGSPSCGVITTSSGYSGGLPTGPGPASVRVSGRGVFMDVLFDELARRSVPFRVDEVGKKKGKGGES